MKSYLLKISWFVLLRHISYHLTFVIFFNKYLEHDNNVGKSVAFICKSNPMSCAGNNYRMLLNAKN